ncbi:fused response regulator/phosphatase [Paraconexibacter antarcticus]|uniref:Fused response regulator/phosphatase n=1 Tax=Paraconexibacter antarcticus TaxID=2949664 RepID=A0ABY5DWM3_9ACTN|nr:fused response regulator/phosphatase [Paraconexibacter antarcticus]UTI66423.1 fused response regulator/phosphatase [Paraconexibacter antarcticus]
MAADLEMTPDPGTDDARPIRLLLVEDDDGDAFLVTELLDEAGIATDVTRARTVAEARALLTDGPAPDCVLLDLGLPDASGLDALTQVREVAQTSALVVLTGDVDRSRGLAAVAAGAQDYLVKSQVDEDRLDRSIRYAVQRSHAELAARSLRDAARAAEENRRLERGLLPVLLVDHPRLAVGARYLPGRRRALLGGDFYDAVQSADGVVHALLGDVSGHGPDEAALGVCLRIAWRTLQLAGAGPDDTLAVLEEVLIHERHDEDAFATLCMIALDEARGSLDVRLAGHPAPIIVDGTGTARVVGGMERRPPLGVAWGARAPAVDVTLAAGDAVVLYSDGLTEGRAAGGRERLGDDALCAVASEQARALDGWRGHPTLLIDATIAAVQEANGGPLADDAAMLVLAQRSPAGDAPAAASPPPSLAVPPA